MVFALVEIGCVVARFCFKYISSQLLLLLLLLSLPTHNHLVRFSTLLSTVYSLELFSSFLVCLLHRCRPHRTSWKPISASLPACHSMSRQWPAEIPEIRERKIINRSVTRHNSTCFMYIRHNNTVIYLYIFIYMKMAKQLRIVCVWE